MPSRVMGENLNRESVHTFSRFSWSVDSACDIEFLGCFPFCRMTLDKMQYEDPVRQDAAKKTVPLDEIEEKTSVALAKVHIIITLCVSF